MKQTVIVKSKEDIKPGMYCKAIEYNFNELKKLGFKLPYDEFSKLISSRFYQHSDVLCYEEYGIVWKDRYSVIDACEGIHYVEFTFQEEFPQFSVENVGFMEPESFKAQIFTQYRTATSTEYIGAVNGNIPAKWDANGQCLNPSSGYNLYKEYKQRIYTKKNSPDFYPRQKFKISWTEAMSTGLEQSGWILATNDEIEQFKTI